MHGLRCAAYSLGFFAVGYALALPGATLPFLEAAASASERAIGLIFVFRGTCYTAASLAGGFIGDAPRLRGATRGAHAAMAASLGLAAAGLGCARRAFSPPLLGLALAAASLAMGALDTLGNVALLASARRAAPDRSANCEMGLAHAAFGAGCVAAPLAAAFLGGRGAYDVGAAGLAAAAVATVAVPGVGASEAADGAKAPLAPRSPGAAKAAACALFFVYVGTEQGCGGLLASASGLRERLALRCTALFWAALVAGRLLFARVPDRRVDRALAFLLAAATAAAAAVAVARPRGDGMAWAAFAAAVGFCYGPVYPAAMARLEAGCPLSSRFTGVLVSAGGFGEIALVPLLFQLDGVYGSSAFPVTLAVANGLALVAALVLARGLRSSGRAARFELVSRTNSAWDDADDELDWDGSYADFDTSTLGDAAGFV